MAWEKKIGGRGTQSLSVDWSPDGSQLAVGDQANTVTVLIPADELLLSRLESYSPPSAFVYTRLMPSTLWGLSLASSRSAADRAAAAPAAAARSAASFSRAALSA